MNTIDLLLVEDDSRTELLINYALNQLGIKINIRCKRDGSDALEYLFPEHDNPPDLPRLILLDLKLPTIDGAEVVKVIREHHRTQLLPVVVFTSSAEAKDINKCYRLGVSSYVVKPLDFDEFSHVVQTIATYWLELNEQAEPD